MTMNIKAQIIISIIIILGIVYIINMVRKKALELRYSLTWLGVGISASKMSIQIKDLTQESALYKKEKNEKVDEIEKK